MTVDVWPGGTLPYYIEYDADGGWPCSNCGCGQDSHNIDWGWCSQDQETCQFEPEMCEEKLLGLCGDAWVCEKRIYP